MQSNERDAPRVRTWRPGSIDTRRAAAWGAGGLLAALVLLVAFYLVVEQAMQRARQHWMPGQAAGLARCDPGQAPNPSGRCEAGIGRR